ALAGQPEDGPVADSDGNVHVEAPALVERDAALGAPQQVLYGHRQLGLDIAARHREPHTSSPAGAPCPAENRGEEVAESAPILVERGGIDRTPFGAAPGRRCEVHPALPVRAERIVLGALVRIAQDLVGLVDLLEPLGGPGALGGRLKIRVMLARELAVDLLDLLRLRGARHTEHLVVVPKLHRHGSRAFGAAATTTCAGRNNSSPSRQPRRSSRTTVPGSTLSDGDVATASWKFGSNDCPTLSTGSAPASRSAVMNCRCVAAIPS